MNWIILFVAGILTILTLLLNAIQIPIEISPVLRNLITVISCY